MVGKNYLVNECADTFLKILGWKQESLGTNIYGPVGTFDGGREKAPAAICRKIIMAKKNKEKN